MNYSESAQLYLIDLTQLTKCRYFYSQKPEGLIGGGLSDYKPSSLLIEIPDSNIDNKLGVKNLVSSITINRSPQKTNQAPIAKSRNNVDLCSATNNGSVIYAQPNSIRNGYNNSTLCSKENNNRQQQNGNSNYNSQHFNDSRTSSSSSSSLKESHQMVNESNNNNNKINAIGTLHRNGTPATTLQHSTKTLDSKKNFNNQPRLVNYTNRIQPETPSSINNHNSEEDLSHHSSNNNSNKWSNGTLSTTSDLLF